MTAPANVREYRDQLTGMILELRTNQATLVKLGKGYGVFAFTGGDLPTGQCGIEAVVSYLKCPFASDRVSTGEVDRYGHLVVAMMRLGQEAQPPRPRTLRCRHQIAEAFARVSSEARSLGASLESTFSGLLRELGPLLSVRPTRDAS